MNFLDPFFADKNKTHTLPAVVFYLSGGQSSKGHDPVFTNVTCFFESSESFSVQKL